MWVPPELICQNESSRAPSICEQPPNSCPRLSLQPSQALQPPPTFEGPLQVVNMSEDGWEPDLESEEEPPNDDESRGQNDGAGSSVGSDGSENEEDWHARSEHHWHAGTHNLWLVYYRIFDDFSVTIAQWWRARHIRNLVIRKVPGSIPAENTLPQIHMDLST